MTVADVELSQRYLVENPDAYEAIADSILMILDRKRFPWVLEEREPTAEENDLIVTLFDGRYMPIECKVSSSSLNSIKRLNNDSLAKFAAWTTYFGAGQTIPVAVLEGVYNLERLVAAQAAGASIVWSHKLEALGGFAESTKS